MSGGSLMCFKCGEIGHVSAVCQQAQAVCYNCKKAGHLKQDCPEPKAPVSCYRCGRQGHISSECAEPRQTQCYTCGETGHISRECPNATAVGANGAADATCYLCGKTGHLQRNCPQNPNPQPARVGSPGAGRGFAGLCNRCGQPGHMAKNCMAPFPRAVGPAGRGVPPIAVRGLGPLRGGLAGRGGGAFNMAALAGALPSANVRCYVCQGVGHISRDCPSKGVLGVDGVPPGVKCYLCGGVGHMQRNCPQANTDTKCFQCGESGHVSADCPSLECYKCGGRHFARNCTDPSGQLVV